MSISASKPAPLLPPGTYIEEWLEDEGIQQQELAERLGASTKHLSQVINGHKSISTNFAEKLALVTGYPTEFWLVHQAKYDARRSELKISDTDTSLVRSILDGTCISRLRRAGIIKSTWQQPNAVVLELFAHFRVASVSALHTQMRTATQPMAVAYRQSTAFETKQPKLWTWLEIVKFKALQQVDLPPFTPKNLAEVVTELKAISTQSPDAFIELVTKALNSVGVAFVAEPDISGARISGASFLLGETPVISITDKQKREDVFWFTLFHEIAHVIRGDIENVHLDVGEQFDVSAQESRADAWASQQLIPTGVDALDLNTQKPSGPEIQELARLNQVSAAIIIGRIQHETREFSWGAEFIRRFEILQ